MRNVTWLLRCYPRRWRERYQEEMLALLEQHTITTKTVLDLLLGAFDARLRSLYQLKGEAMFQRIRDNRSLSIIYMSSIAIFLFSIVFWNTLNQELNYHDNVIASTTTKLLWMVGNISSTLMFIALIVITVTTIKNAFRNSQGGTLLFAFFCFALNMCALVWLLLSLSRLRTYIPFISYLITCIEKIEILFSLGCGLFLIVVKGLKLLRSRQGGWPLVFALVIGLLLPVTELAGQGIQWSAGGTVSIPAGAIMTGTNSYITWNTILLFLFLGFTLYLPLSALLLTLVEGNLSQRGWQIARIFALLWIVILLLELAIVVIWDVNCWIGNTVLVPSLGMEIWAFFDGQWIGPLIANALLLAIALGLALFALVRSFLIQPEEEHAPESEVVNA